MTISSLNLLLESPEYQSETFEEHSQAQAAGYSTFALDPEQRTQKFFDLINSLHFEQAAEWSSVRADAKVSDWSNSEMSYNSFVASLREISARVVGPQVRVIDVTTYVNRLGTTAIAFVHGECMLAEPDLPSFKREGMWTLKWRKLDNEWRLYGMDLIKGIVIG